MSRRRVVDGGAGFDVLMLSYLVGEEDVLAEDRVSVRVDDLVLPVHHLAPNDMNQIVHLRWSLRRFQAVYEQGL